jgi:acyl-CoA thioester hydrolase
MTPRSTSTIRVRYAETDQAGVAYHGAYFAWFEVGRTDLLRGLGMTYRELERAGLRLPVVETRARFLKPVFYDDVLEIRTTLVELGGARVGFDYELHRQGTEGPTATASTSHAAVDASGRVRRLPEELRLALGAAPAAAGAGSSW